MNSIEINVNVSAQAACKAGLRHFGHSVVQPTDDEWMALSSDDRQRLSNYIGSPNSRLEVSSFCWEAILAELPMIRQREIDMAERAQSLRQQEETRRRENMAQIAERILRASTLEALPYWPDHDFAQYGRDVVAHVEHLKQMARNRVQQALSEADAAEGVFVAMQELRRHPEIGRHPWLQSHAIVSSDSEAWDRMTECAEGHPQIVALLKSIRTAHESHVQRKNAEREARQAEQARQVAEVREWAKSIAPAAVEAGYSVAAEIAKAMYVASYAHCLDKGFAVDNQEPLHDRKVTDAREEWVLKEQQIRQGFAELLSKLPPHSTVQLWDDEDGKRALRRRTFESYGGGDVYAARIGVCVLVDCPPAGDEAHVELFVVVAYDDGNDDENDDD